ncbi:TetR/AcrR family transcriptional regulator [Rhizobium calliandrae]|uniref:TetR/AcrR family transcriptional regulator n=1 Tax=Rhizobium calliandrae TaxID=1312182 RepID=A0ABT7KP52_9HYPH|nr:TetR/AcrR family transcriptional regulator [Rhizobium calliandrae]MDL2410386.1 TetR/AcrR family transcriptional regulator [Rhizobium calliandrae]
MAIGSRKNDPEGMRRKIIEASFAVMSRGGYTASSMHDLREASNVSSGAFAHHFPSKKALGLCVVREGIAPAVADAWIIPVSKATSALAGIRDAFSAIIAELERNGSVSGCPLNNLAVEMASHDAELRQEMDAIFQNWRAAIAGKLCDDLDSGLASDLDPQKAAMFVVAVYSGAMAMAKASQTTAPLRDSLSELINYFRPSYRSDAI